MIPNQTLRFLHALYGEQRTGYLTLTAIHPSKQQPTPSRHIPIQDAAAVQAALLDLQRANQLGWGAYFSVALRNSVLDRWHRGGQTDLLTLPVLFADLDGNLSSSLTTLQNAGIAGLP